MNESKLVRVSVEGKNQFLETIQASSMTNLFDHRMEINLGAFPFPDLAGLNYLSRQFINSLNWLR